MKLLQNSGVPIYQQIATQFKEDILSGKLKQGEYLPSIRGLAKDLKISVITTMKAYEQLEQEKFGDFQKVDKSQNHSVLCCYIRGQS